MGGAGLGGAYGTVPLGLGGGGPRLCKQGRPIWAHLLKHGPLRPSARFPTPAFLPSPPQMLTTPIRRLLSRTRSWIRFQLESRPQLGPFEWGSEQTVQPNAPAEEPKHRGNPLSLDVRPVGTRGDLCAPRRRLPEPLGGPTQPSPAHVLTSPCALADSASCSQLPAILDLDYIPHPIVPSCRIVAVHIGRPVAWAKRERPCCEYKRLVW